MKKNKKSIAAFVAALMLFAVLAGCVSNKTETADNTGAPSFTAEPTGAATQEPSEAPTEAPAEAPSEAPTEAPTEPPAPEAMIPQLFTGHERTFLLYPDGALYGWGINEYGQIGVGNCENVLAPELVMEDCTRVFICPDNTFALKNDGTLWGWGRNEYGSLGIESEDIVSSPMLLRDDVAEVFDGWWSTVFLTNDGRLLQAHDVEGAGGETRERITEVAAVHDRHVVKTNGDLYVLYYEDNVPIDKGVQDVYPYYEATPFAYLKTNGELWFCDCPESIYDPHNRLLGTDVVRAWNLTCDYDEEYDFLALKNDGSLWEYFECNYKPCFEKKLMDGASDVVFAQTHYGYSSRIHTFVLTETGELWYRGEFDAASGADKGGAGEDDIEIEDLVKVADNVASVTTNGVGSYIIKNDGSLWGCGVVVKGFRTGGIGEGSYEEVWGFTKIMDNVASFAQLTRSWEEIDEDDEGGDEPNTLTVASTRYAVLEDGSVWAWGSGKFCSIGNGDTKRADEPVKIMEPRFK